MTGFFSTILNRTTTPSAAEVAFFVNSGLDLRTVRERFAASDEFAANG